jgi:membrane protein
MRRVSRRLPKWRGYSSYRFLFKVWINFQKSGGISCCSSLSYTLLLAFIPFSISMASISSWLPVSNTLINDVQLYFFSKFIPQSGTEIYDLFKLSFTHSSRLSILGLLSLLGSCYAMMFTVEQHIHHMWQIKRQRSLINSLLLFTGFFLAGPLLVYFVALIVEFLDLFVIDPNLRRYIAFLAANLVTLISYIIIYKFLPSKPVRWRHAIGAGSLAGIAFGVLEQYFSYSMLQLKEEYSLLYGSLAMLPIFMLWLYLSVLILLMGAQIIYVLELKKRPVK